MIVHLNGLPGVGKLTVARLLAQRLNGRLLDNHTVANVAFSLLDFGAEGFFETVQAVRTIAYDRILAMGASVPIVLTGVLPENHYGRETWAAIQRLARDRRSTFCAVTLTCAEAEHTKRLTTPSRAAMLKLTDPQIVKTQYEHLPMIEDGADHLLRIDVTALAPEMAAAEIAAWASGLHAAQHG